MLECFRRRCSCVAKWNIFNYSFWRERISFSHLLLRDSLHVRIMKLLLETKSFDPNFRPFAGVVHFCNHKRLFSCWAEGLQDNFCNTFAGSSTKPICLFCPASGSYQFVPLCSPTGFELLYQPEVVRLYLSLLTESQNYNTLEAAAGALQNLSAGQWTVSLRVGGVGVVQRQDAMFTLTFCLIAHFLQTLVWVVAFRWWNFYSWKHQLGVNGIPLRFSGGQGR